MDKDDRLDLSLDERAIRTLHQAVAFTLDKWTGQEPIDQVELQGLRYFLEKALLEYQFSR